MRRELQRLAGMAVVTLIATTAITAADLAGAIDAAETRRRAAESGLREIKPKGKSSDDVRKAYGDAATAHNTWLMPSAPHWNRGALDLATRLLSPWAPLPP
jgi:hypothetical protein